MKADLHPQWYSEAQIICACGNTFTTGSSIPEIHVEICSKCHPLFTGEAKLVDTLGQVDRYTKKMKTSQIKQAERKIIIEARKAKVEVQKKERPSLKELLMKARKQTAS